MSQSLTRVVDILSNILHSGSWVCLVFGVARDEPAGLQSFRVGVDGLVRDVADSHVNALKTSMIIIRKTKRSITIWTYIIHRIMNLHTIVVDKDARGLKDATCHKRCNK